MGRVSLRVKPGSSKVEVKMVNHELRIKLKSAPVGGKANQELIAFLSKKLRVPKSDISIVKGQTSKSKVIEVKGLTEDEIIKGLLK